MTRFLTLALFTLAAATATAAGPEVTGIRAEPAHADTRRWRYAQTTHPLGKSHLWDAPEPPQPADVSAEMDL